MNLCRIVDDSVCLIFGFVWIFGWIFDPYLMWLFSWIVEYLMWIFGLFAKLSSAKMVALPVRFCEWCLCHKDIKLYLMERLFIFTFHGASSLFTVLCGIQCFHLFSLCLLSFASLVQFILQKLVQLLLYSMIVWNWIKVNSYISALKPLPRLPNSSKWP